MGHPAGSCGLSLEAPGQRGRGAFRASSPEMTWSRPSLPPGPGGGRRVAGLLEETGIWRLQKPDWGTSCVLGVWSGVSRVSALFSLVTGYSLTPCFPVMGGRGAGRERSIIPAPAHCLGDRGPEGAGCQPSIPVSGLWVSLSLPVSVQSLLCTIGLFTQ